MSRTIHVIGNGESAKLYEPSKGIKVTCNLPPFKVENVWATCMVDFKMMKAMRDEHVHVPGDWILGARPKKYIETYPNLRIKWIDHIKEFYTELPDYVNNFTDLNCGHMAVHYSANKLRGTEIHLYGFDSMFDDDMKSCTDSYLVSDRSDENNIRLINNWRPIWKNMFEEFSETQFILHYKHNNLPFEKPKNVKIVVYK